MDPLIGQAWTTASLTDVGRTRTENQDAVAVLDRHHPDLASGWLAFASVADGAGGHAAGGEAARVALAAMLSAVQEQPLPDEVGLGRRMSRWILLANERVQELAKSVGDQVGTTLTAIALTPDKVVLGHIGDSRCYRLRAGQLAQLSEDHTAVAEALRKGELTPEQAATSPFRHQLLRGLGLGLACKPQALIEDLLEGDLYLLCSDGLWEYVSDAEIAELLNRPAGLHAALDDLLALALARGGADNISLAAVRCGQSPAAAATPGSSRSTFAVATVLTLLGIGLGILIGGLLLKKRQAGPEPSPAPVVTEAGQPSPEPPPLRPVEPEPEPPKPAVPVQPADDAQQPAKTPTRRRSQSREPEPRSPATDTPQPPVARPPDHDTTPPAAGNEDQDDEAIMYEPWKEPPASGNSQSQTKAPPQTQAGQGKAPQVTERRLGDAKIIENQSASSDQGGLE